MSSALELVRKVREIIERNETEHPELRLLLVRLGAALAEMERDKPFIEAALKESEARESGHLVTDAESGLEWRGMIVKAEAAQDAAYRARRAARGKP